MHIDGSIRINPTNAVIDAATVLFAVAADEDAFNPVCKHKQSSVSNWIDQFQLNRREGNHAARQRNKHIKQSSPGALARVFAASANPNFAQQNKLQSSSLLSNKDQQQEEGMSSFMESLNNNQSSIFEYGDSFGDSVKETFREPVRQFSDSDLTSVEKKSSEPSSVNRPPMLGKNGFHSSPSQRNRVSKPMTAKERRASFASRDVRALMKSTKKELIEKFKRESQPDSNLERLMNVVEQGGHTVLLMMMDDDLEDLEVDT